MSIIEAMAKFRCDAAQARCRVQRWRLSEDQAWALAYELGNMGYIPRDPGIIVDSMKAGTARMFGAMVTVR